MARGGFTGKTKRRVESLLAWIAALAIVLLLLAGAYFVAYQAGVV